MKYILSIILMFLLCGPVYGMKLRVMGEIIGNPVDFENLLIGKAFKRKIIIPEKRLSDGQQIVRLDIVAEKDADTEKFFRDCKIKVTKGKFHIHKCYHKEFGELEDKPCEIIEEVNIP